MKTTIKTQTAGIVVINSTYLGDKQWPNTLGERLSANWNNHRVTVSSKGRRFAFEFWGSIVSPKITTYEENIFAFYCALSDAIAAKESFEDFCNTFGYDPDSRTAERVYKACKKTLSKIERVFDCDHYDLINEIQETYNY